MFWNILNQVHTLVALFYFMWPRPPLTASYHMLPSGAASGGGGQTLTCPNFLFCSSHLPIAPASRAFLPPLAVHSVSVEGRVEIQRSYYLKTFVSTGQVYSLTNTTACDQIFNKQRRHSNYLSNALMWHLRGVNTNRSIVLHCTWWRSKVTEKRR